MEWYEIADLVLSTILAVLIFLNIVWNGHIEKEYEARIEKLESDLEEIRKHQDKK